MMINHTITQLVEEAAQAAQKQGLIPLSALPYSPVEHPQNPEHGDYASSLALKLARSTRMNPLSIAQAVTSLLPSLREVESVSIAPPGFINFRLSDHWLCQQTESIIDAGASYGDLEIGKGASIQVEFVSANPTGPLHVGNGRGAVLGSALANILSAAGYSVHKEYYINDAGTQIEVFSRSLHARYLRALGRDEPFPEDGYAGQYLLEMGRELAEEYGEGYVGKPSELSAIGMSQMLSIIRRDLEDLGVTFDTWFSEASLYKDGQYQRVMDLLRGRGYLTEKEGALWFVSSQLGEDKDNVFVRTSGAPTYFASDAAYHYNKFVERGFNRAIDIWGADHLGHVSRVKAVVGALGIDPDRLQVIITQLVTLKRGQEIVRLSKRTGDIITLREVIDEVGADACRFIFLSRSADSQSDFDLELAVRQSNENPVYYVQYAHARIASILRYAIELDIDWSRGDVSPLTMEPELALIRKMVQLPEMVEAAAQTFEPHNLPHYAMDLATLFHSFYTQCRVVSEDMELSRARLKLVEAAKIVLARTLALMGMTAPESM